MPGGNVRRGVVQFPSNGQDSRSVTRGGPRSGEDRPFEVLFGLGFDTATI